MHQAAPHVLWYPSCSIFSHRLLGAPQITPDWERLTWHIEHDKETKERLGWVREMYAWSIGAALQASLQQQLFIYIHTFFEDIRI